MVVGFLFSEFTGLSAGGIVVPGYLAFFWGNPYRLLTTLFAALLTNVVVKGLSHVVIIFGRRRFMVNVMIGYVMGWALFTAARWLPLGSDLRTIGYVIPGLIANDMYKQGVVKTILAVGVVSLFVRLILLVLI
jgi:poly-gamma-glutamate biosynthesis protein PgsC/CapC